jgi:hypothetical protein
MSTKNILIKYERDMSKILVKDISIRHNYIRKKRLQISMNDKTAMEKER